MTVKEYDDAMSAIRFIRDQAIALIESANELERETKNKATKYLGEQSSRDGALTPIRHRLMEKQLGREVSFDGPAPNIVEK